MVSLGAACGDSFDASSGSGNTAGTGGSSGGINSTGGDHSSSGGDHSSGAGDSSSSGGDAGSVSSTDSGSFADHGNVADAGVKKDGAITVSTPAVNLRTAGSYAILAKSGISTVPTSAITGNIAVSPAAVTYITGFALTADPTNVFSTSLQVTGKVFAANHAVPTPSNLTTAIGDMQLAFTDAAGRAPNVTELGAGNIGGLTLTPGVYKWATGLLIPTSVTLAGSATDVWIFQIAQNLNMASATKIVLSGGAVPKNVFWQIAGLADLGTTSHLEGVVLSQTSIALHTGASIKGRLLAQTAITLDGNAVVEPAL